MFILQLMMLLVLFGGRGSIHNRSLTLKNINKRTAHAQSNSSQVYDKENKNQTNKLFYNSKIFSVL